MSEDNRLEAISEALARLIRRQDEMEARFARIEKAMGIEATPPPFVATPARPPAIPTAVYTEAAHIEAAHMEAAPPPLPPPIAPPVAEQQKPPALETRIGLNWINIAGVVTMIFGAAFFFKYAVDNNWVGPGARVALGIVAAMVALFFGDRMWTRGQKVFGQGITGLGLALLYLSFWASFGLYHLVPQPIAFLLMVLTTAASVVFAMRYESQVIALIGILAGYWTPGALSTGEPHPWILFSYIFLLNMGALALTRLRRWLAIEYLAAAATILWYGAWMINGIASSDHPVATVFAIVFYVQFCFTSARPLWAVIQLLGPLAMLNIWSAPERLLPLLHIYIVGGLIVAEVRRWPEAPTWTLTCFWGICFLSGHDNPELRFLFLTGAFALFFFWIVWWRLMSGRSLRNTDLFVLVANAAAYFGGSYYLLNPQYHAYMGLFAVALGALNLFLAKLVWEEKNTQSAQLAIAVTLTFLTLAVPIQFAGFRITMAWALEGAALAWLSARFNSMRMSIAASVVLILTVLRLFTIDAPISSNRFLTFAVGAISLFLAAKFFADRAQKLTAYVAAHIVTLTAFGMELIDWVQRSVAEPNRFETGTVSISILMALYAVMLVTIGVLTKTSINRLLGLILMALVVVKLYLSDVWELGFLFRIVAFLGLGVLLLTVSYLYSHYRPMIEKLLKDDPSA